MLLAACLCPLFPGHGGTPLERAVDPDKTAGADGSFEAILTPPAGWDVLADAGFPAHFGASVAAGSHGVVVGAPGADVEGEARGAVLRFVQTPAGWVRAGSALVDPQGESGDRFGAAVATLGRWVAVGAPRAGVEGGGRTLVYDVSIEPPRLEVVLAGAPSTSGTPLAGLRFGHALALAEDAAGLRLAVGAPGAPAGGVPSAGRVEWFVRRGGRWRRDGSVASDAPSLGQAFGHALTEVAGTWIVGAPGDGRDVPAAGRVLGFGPDGALRFSIGPVGEEPAGAALAGARFGSSVGAVAPETFAAGAPGQALIVTFDLAQGGGLESSSARRLRGEPGTGFGLRLAGGGGVLAAPSPWASQPEVAVYRKGLTGGWRGPAQHMATDRLDAASEYGIALCVLESQLFVGAPGTGSDPFEAPVPVVSAGRVLVHGLGG